MTIKRHSNLESQRLAYLHSLNIVDSEPEERFDRYTRLAKRLFQVPSAIFTVIDYDREWIKSRQGFALTQIARGVSFCQSDIPKNKAIIIEDTLNDPRFRNNPLADIDPSIRFYASCPIIVEGNYIIGALCLLDDKPHTMSEEDLRILLDLSKMIAAEFDQVQTNTTDALTGLSNRSGFEAIAAHCLHNCQRLECPLSFIFLDIDLLKTINDKYGRREGDFALIEVAEILKDNFRRSDLIARIGGDEFCIVCSGVDETINGILLNRLAESFKARNIGTSAPYALHYSVDVITTHEDDNDTIETLLQEADGLICQRKKSQQQH